MRNCGKLLIVNSVSAPVAQLDRASGYEPEGREFESPRAHHFLNLPFVAPTLLALNQSQQHFVAQRGSNRPVRPILAGTERLLATAAHTYR